MHTKSYCYFLMVFSISNSMIASSATAADTDPKEIMQELRDNVVEITDGLLTDDFTKVAEAALRIANHARIPPDQIQLVAAELGTEMAAF